jgi:hypothetical protein
VTHILLEEGHLWGRKQVAIPVSAVASIEDGIRLNITKRQVEDLPPLGGPDDRRRDAPGMAATRGPATDIQGAAIAGIIFGAFLITALVLLRVSVPGPFRSSRGVAD